MDTGHGHHTTERCEAACYDCLRSYYNQQDHELVDRHLIAPILIQYTRAVVESSTTAAPRETHLEALLRQCQSDLERRWLNTLQERGLRLPSHAQYRVEAARVRADFAYRDHHLLVFVDGPPHQYEAVLQRDRDQDEALADLGYVVVRFTFHAPWDAIFAQFPETFGVTP